MPAGRPKGSKTKNSTKPFRDALMRVIAEQGDDPKAMVRVAKKLIAEAEGGNVQAIRELADRLDGKPAQAIEGGDKPIRMVHEIERRIVRPDRQADN